MKAAVVHGFSKPLVIEDVPKPIAGWARSWSGSKRQVCVTPTSTPRMGWPVNGKQPFIPGHEGVGIVESLGGRGNRGRGGQPGRLAMARIRCGTCGYCTTGWETLCEQQRNTGYSVDGGYAEYAAATAKYVA